MRNVIIPALTILLVCTSPRSAAAWGFDVHKFITARAIPLLPEPIRPFFVKYEATIVEHSVDPDLWRNAGFVEEPPRHFVDMDAYGAYPFSRLPHEYDAAVQKFGKAFVDRNGTVPWRAEEMYRKLVDAFTQTQGYSRDNIKFFASVIAHYTADAHVPFHAALNYGGQLTGQFGIHSRFESELFARYRSTLTIGPGPLVKVTSARDLVFGALLTSFPLVQPLLDADKAAASGREVYDDAYFTAFFGKARPILEQRMSESITSVASVITAAWIEAGSPALSPDAPAPAPRRIGRQQER